MLGWNLGPSATQHSSNGQTVWWWDVFLPIFGYAVTIFHQILVRSIICEVAINIVRSFFFNQSIDRSIDLIPCSLCDWLRWFQLKARKKQRSELLPCNSLSITWCRWNDWTWLQPFRSVPYSAFAIRMRTHNRRYRYISSIPSIWIFYHETAFKYRHYLDCMIYICSRRATKCWILNLILITLTSLCRRSMWPRFHFQCIGKQHNSFQTLGTLQPQMNTPDERILKHIQIERRRKDTNSNINRMMQQETSTECVHLENIIESNLMEHQIGTHTQKNVIVATFSSDRSFNARTTDRGRLFLTKNECNRFIPKQIKFNERFRVFYGSCNRLHARARNWIVATLEVESEWRWMREWVRENSVRRSEHTDTKRNSKTAQNYHTKKRCHDAVFLAYWTIIVPYPFGRCTLLNR